MYERWDEWEKEEREANKRRKVITLILIALWVVFAVAVAYWYTQDYEVDKCKTISSNDYYSAQEDCYNVLHKPYLELFLGIIVFTFVGAFPFGIPIAVMWFDY